MRLYYTTLYLIFANTAFAQAYTDFSPISTENKTPFELQIEKQTKSKNTPIHIVSDRFVVIQEFTRLPKTINSTPINEIAQIYVDILEASTKKVEDFFEYRPRKKVSLRLTSRYIFTRKLNAPSWTKALYYKNEIIVPIDNELIPTDLQSEALQDTLRHEYTHALITDMIGHNCPAWLDEGLAQLMENTQNSKIAGSLKKWSATGINIPLEDLSAGFINTDSETITFAYAKSFFATKFIINKFGKDKIIDFLKLLRSDSLSNKCNPNYIKDVFQKIYGITFDEFNKELNHEIMRWLYANKNEI